MEGRKRIKKGERLGKGRIKEGRCDKDRIKTQGEGRRKERRG